MGQNISKGFFLRRHWQMSMECPFSFFVFVNTLWWKCPLILKYVVSVTSSPTRLKKACCWSHNFKLDIFQNISSEVKDLHKNRNHNLVKDPDSRDKLFFGQLSIQEATNLYLAFKKVWNTALVKFCKVCLFCNVSTFKGFWYVWIRPNKILSYDKKHQCNIFFFI